LYVPRSAAQSCLPHVQSTHRREEHSRPVNRTNVARDNCMYTQY
jgi:hypothetical protein